MPGGIPLFNARGIIRQTLTDIRPEPLPWTSNHIYNYAYHNTNHCNYYYIVTNDLKTLFVDEF